MESYLNYSQEEALHRILDKGIDYFQKSPVRNKESPSFSAGKFSFEESFREIENLERRITPVKRQVSSVELDNLRGDLKRETTRNGELKRENKILSQRLERDVELEEKFQKLMGDYKTLALSFQRSEEVRQQQNQLIQWLKQQIQPKKVVKKRGKKTVRWKVQLNKNYQLQSKYPFCV